MGSNCNLQNHAIGGSGGGFEGLNTYGFGRDYEGNGFGSKATQKTAGCSNYGYWCGYFGSGYITSEIHFGLTGGGGGYYGGGSGGLNGGGGGSGYIGNSLLTDKHMACYNCETSDEESTKTISVTCASETPTPDCAKEGHGYARITYLGSKN